VLSISSLHLSLSVLELSTQQAVCDAGLSLPSHSPSSVLYKNWAQVSVHATGPKGCGVEPGQGDGFLRATKIHSTSSFGWEGKPEVPCRKILHHVKDLLKSNRLNSHFLLPLAPDMSRMAGLPDSTGGCQSALVDKLGVSLSHYHHAMVHMAYHPGMNNRPAVLRRQCHPIIASVPSLCLALRQTPAQYRSSLSIDRCRLAFLLPSLQVRALCRGFQAARHKRLHQHRTQGMQSVPPSPHVPKLLQFSLIHTS
jgi:hypothetical protein